MLHDWALELDDKGLRFCIRSGMATYAVISLKRDENGHVCLEDGQRAWGNEFAGLISLYLKSRTRFSASIEARDQAVAMLKKCGRQHSLVGLGSLWFEPIGCGRGD